MATTYLKAYFDKYMPADIKANYSSSSNFCDRELASFVRQILDNALLSLFVYNVWAILIL